MTVLLYRTVQSFLVNMTSQSLSHSLTTKSSDWSNNAGMIWPVVACCGSVGQIMVQWGVDVSMELSGMVTLSWLVVGRTSFTDASVDKK